MKKLQKAVHRKESSVALEKAEFEQTRKELELNIKDFKRDLENNEREL